jgi:putative endonuclease
MFVYVLKSLRDSNHYVGISQDPLKRVKSYNEGKCFSTKTRKPFILIYTEECEDIATARKREKYLKSYAGSKEKLFITNAGV